MVAAGIVTSVWAAGVEVRRDKGATQAEICLRRVTVAQVMLGQALTVETAAVIRSLGLQARDLQQGVPPSQRICGEGEVKATYIAPRAKYVQVVNSS